MKFLMVLLLVLQQETASSEMLRLGLDVDFHQIFVMLVSRLIQEEVTLHLHLHQMEVLG